MFKVLCLLALLSTTPALATPDAPAVNPAINAPQEAPQEAGEGTQSPIVKALLNDDKQKEKKLTNK